MISKILVWSQVKADLPTKKSPMTIGSECFIYIALLAILYVWKKLLGPKASDSSFILRRATWAVNVAFVHWADTLCKKWKPGMNGASTLPSSQILSEVCNAAPLKWDEYDLCAAFLTVLNVYCSKNRARTHTHLPIATVWKRCFWISGGSQSTACAGWA